MASSLVTLARNLQQRKGRKRTGLAVAEGVRLVEEALQSGIPIQGALASRSLETAPRGTELLEELAARSISIHRVADGTLADLADTETPQGILAIVEPPIVHLDSILPLPGAPVVVLDAVQDPGNAGTLLRTAFGLGAGGAILLKGSADLTNPKVLRAAMGASFQLPVARATQPEFAEWVETTQTEIWVAAISGTPLAQVSRPEYLTFVVGNEGAGVRDEVARHATQRVAIPLAHGAESLNVAIAAGIILYEVQRG
ncbi:MAG: TrmH family RNA methyltransferase [Gemmatimonadales bacterium]